jgi:DHA2 family multidrug resistance protein-like MFS transporter
MLGDAVLLPRRVAKRPASLILYRLDGTLTHMSLTQELSLADAQSRRVGWRGWAALVVLMLPVLLVSVDNTVLSFALPQIALDLEPTAIQQLWIIDAYPLVLASLLVTMGTLGDRFGRRRMLLIGATGFGLVSALAAFAPTAEWLIAARAVMGVFGAMLMPSTLSLLRSIFTDRDQRRLAIAVWAAAFSAGAALGPVIGGILLEHFAWGSVFLMAVPVLVPLLILVPILVPESRDPRPGRFDLLSVVLSLATMVPIVYAIKEFAAHGAETALPFVLIVAGVGFGVLFARRQNRLETPMLDMRLFRRATFTGSVLVNLLSVIGLVGFLYFVAQHLQLIAGLSPLEAGLALVPGLLAMIVAGIGIVPIAKRVAPRVVVPTALAFSILGYLLVAVAASTGMLTLLIVAFVSLGVGIGAAETVSNELILASAPPSKAGAASAVSETAYELGAVLGTTIIGGLLAAFYRSSLELPPGLPDVAADAARETLAGAVAVSHTLDDSIGQALRDAAAHAFDAGVGVTSLIGAALIVVAAVIAALTLGGKAHREPVDH